MTAVKLEIGPMVKEVAATATIDLTAFADDVLQEKVTKVDTNLLHALFLCRFFRLF